LTLTPHYEKITFVVRKHTTERKFLMDTFNDEEYRIKERCGELK